MTELVGIEHIILPAPSSLSIIWHLQRMFAAFLINSILALCIILAVDIAEKAKPSFKGRVAIALIIGLVTSVVANYV